MPQNAGKRLVEAIGKQLERVEYFSSAENISPNVAVHEMRKTFKRLRALLKFYNDFPVEFPPDYSTQIKYFGRSLTVMRESFVNLQLFEKITAGNTLIPERKMKNARERLSDKNKEIIEKGFLKSEAYLPMQRFASNLQMQMEQIAVSIPAVTQFTGQLKYSYSQSYEIYLKLKQDSESGEIHDLRKKLKQLYYQFDFIRYVHPRFFRLKTYHLNNITEQLGEDHDLFIFINELIESRYDFSENEIEILENQVMHLREINRIKMFPRLKQFFSDHPEVFNSKLEDIFKMPVN
jgi:CHAD domain-containing protein